MKRVFIVRHGNTFEANEPTRRIGARSDLDLTATGLDQAHRLGVHLDGVAPMIERVLCGPLRRTQQTAAAICEHLRLRPRWQTVSWLKEIDHGPDEGVAEDAVVARIGKAALAAWDREATVPPGWPIDRDKQIAAWRSFLASPPAVETLLVTSNGVARFALIAAGIAADRDSLGLRTGAWGELATTNGGTRLVSWNVRP